MERPAKIRYLQTIKGIGESKAEAIINAFPEINEVLNILNIKDAYDRLRKVTSTATAASLMEELKIRAKQDEKVREMTNCCDIPYFSALEIANNPLECEAFEKNPYIVGKRHNINFKPCDKFAHRNFLENSPDMSFERMSGLINEMLLELENSGHTFAYLSQLVRKINNYQKKHIYLPNDYSEASILLYLLNNDLFYFEQNTKDIKKWRIYRKETYQLEKDIAYHIRRLSINNQINKSQPFVSNQLQYDEIQLAAINSAVMNGLKVITGPPGSGKTAVINGVISYYEQLNQDNPNLNIVLCAPTGRAAQHMAEITGRRAKTIHKLLGIRKGTQTIVKKKIDCDLLICDEASMLSLELAYEVLSRLKTGTIIYFVGDKDQLPAVGAGNVLYDIIHSGKVPVYALTKVYRQDGIILENAHEINKGIVPTKTDSRYEVYTFNDASLLKKKALEFFRNYYSLKEPFESQILVPSYTTECGIIALNKAIQALTDEDYVTSPETSKEYAYKKNDKILMIKNDKEGRYQNGSVGILKRMENDNLIVNFGEKEDVTLPKTALNDMSLGYAISVHKSQGSEYKNVIFCLPDTPKSMLKRNIFYTGVTRAKEKIKILEMEGAIETCVKTHEETFMQTGLKRRLQEM